MNYENNLRVTSEGYPNPTQYAALTHIIREEQRAQPRLKLVYICSPYSGDVAANVENARRYCRFAVERGAMPLAPHLLYPQFLDDTDADERSLGLRFALLLLGKCDELWAFGDRVSDGMAREIAKAKRRNMVIRAFSTNFEEVYRA
jgi:hypothetical protein